MIFHGKKPVVVLKIILNPNLIDVNIHPKKLEIRFENEKYVYFAIEEAIKKAINENNLLDVKKEKLISKNNSNNINNNSNYGYDVKKDKQVFFNDFKNYENNESSLKETNFETNEYSQNQLDNKTINLASQFLGNFRIIGQLNLTYILIEIKEGLLLLDQHACEERINYEKIQEKIKNKKIDSQILLKPIEENFPLTIVEEIENNFLIYDKLGFEISVLAKDTILIKKIPNLKYIHEDEIIQWIEKIASFIKEKGNDFVYNHLDLIPDRIIETKACRMSIKAGKELTMVEMRNLIERLFKCKKPYTCPHGRPIISKFSYDKIEKSFLRKGF
jgi:DNA mismatch repair protein MutL